MKVGNNTQLLMTLGAVVVAAGSAVAQSSGGFDKPLKAGQPAAGGLTSTTTMMMRQDDGDDSYEIRVEGDKVTAKVNGKEVPQDRVIREKDQIKIVDESGKVLSSFHIASQPGAFGLSGGKGGATSPAPRAQGSGRSRGGARVSPAVPVPPEPPAAVAMPGWEPPKVMLGINMSEPGDGLLKAYGLEKGQAILIDRVIEGLPAEKAGIKENDVITEIDGKKPATPEMLRDALKDKDPGDTVTFTVLRKGGDQNIRVKLEPYDAEKLGGAMTTWVMPKEGDWNEDMKKRMEEAFKHIPQGGRALQWQNDGGPIVVGPEGGFFGAVPNEKLDAKMAELDKKLAELDKKMAKLDELFAKLQAQLEKLPKDR